MAKMSHAVVIFLINIFFCRCAEVTLNISSPGDDSSLNNINKTTYIIDGLPCRKFSPKPSNKIIKVVDGKTKIWESSNKECTGAILYPETGTGKLLHLFVSVPNENDHLYYLREGESWTKIGERDYRKILDEFSPEPAKPAGKPKKSSSHLPDIFTALFIPLLLYTITCS